MKIKVDQYGLIFGLFIITLLQVNADAYETDNLQYLSDVVKSNGRNRSILSTQSVVINKTASISPLEFDSIVADTGDYYSYPMKIILTLLATSCSLITISGNLLVIGAFIIDRQIRNPTNYFLLSLSISDFLIGLFSMPLYTLYLMLGRWPFGEIICNLWLSLDYTVCLTSIYTVFFITVDRFCSVKIPAKYRKWRSRDKIIWIIIATWVIPVLLFFTSIFSWSFTKPFDPLNCDVGWANDVFFSITLIIGYFWVTLILMIVLYCFIYQVAKNLEKKSRDKAKRINKAVDKKTNVFNAAKQPLPNNNRIDAVANQINETNTQNNNQVNKTECARKQSLAKNHDARINSNINDIKNKDDTEYENLIPANETSSTSATAKTEKPTSLELTDIDSKTDVPKQGQSSYSKDDDFSSSFDSQSDYEPGKKRMAFKAAIKKVQVKSKKSLSSIHSNTIILNANKVGALNSPIYPERSPVIEAKDLQPRPETLAILSKDMFEEKCANLSIKARSPRIEHESKTELNKPIENKTPEDKLEQSAQVPFIDDDFDDISYILHRRQFGNKDVNKQPISEETIVIKKIGFFQKLATPIKSSYKAANNNGSNSSTPQIGNADLNNKRVKEEKKTDQIHLIQKDETNSETLPSDTSKEPGTTIKDEAVQLDATDNCSKENEKPVTFADKSTLVKSSAQPKSIFTKPALSSILKPSLQKPKTKYENRAKKALRTITFILGAFVFCWGPFHIVSMIAPFCQICNDSVLFTHFYRSTYFLCYLNSPINPFCYALANQQFKKTFSRILKGDWRRV